MFTLSRTRIMKRSLLALTFLISVASGIFLAAKNIKLFEANADTSYNYDVEINYNENTEDWPSYDGYWHTPIFTMKTGIDKEYMGFCADPRYNPPANGSDDIKGAVLADSDNNKMIKLAIYIYTIKNKLTNEIIIDKGWFSSVNRTYDDYARMHALIGYINTGIPMTYYYPEATDQQAWLDARKSQLLDWVNDENNQVWRIAQAYKLYGLDPSQTTELPAPDGPRQNVFWIEGDPESGNVEIQKCDEEIGADGTGVCKPQAGASFSGIKFEIYNASGNKIYIPSKDEFYESGALIATKTAGSSGKVTFENLPLNVKYLIKESAGTNRSYVFATTGNTDEATITSNNQTVSKTFKNNVIRGDVKFTKTSDVDGEPMSNVVFKIKSTSGAKEEHLVVSDENGVVDTSASHALHSFHTNGYDDMEEDEIEYLAYGTWFGGGTADDAKGALPYDTYEITELECDANKFCYDIDSTKKTFTIETNGEVKDLEEWSNDCVEFSITTTATDNSDGDKILAYDQDVEIKDVVKYCLKEDTEFTIKGTVMNKTTKEPLLVDGKKVEQTITITPDDACGTTETIYSLNTKDLGGTDLVIFEELYYGDELILSHSDFDNTDQTVSVAPPPPDTGAVTKIANNSTSSDNTVMIIFVASSSISLYIGARSFSRRRFLGRKR